MGIVHDQNIVWSHGFGFADRERRVEATAKTIYSICSISKLFTSIAVMQIRDQGRLDLGDSPNQHLPWFDIDQTYPDHAPITIRGMLTHSSGLPRESDFPYWSGPDFEFPSREQVIEHDGEEVLHANTLREMHRVHWLDPDWKGGLAMLSLPSNDPLEALQELRQTEGHRFRRVRDDGELAEEVVFLDADGAVTGFRRNSNVRSKID